MLRFVAFVSSNADDGAQSAAQRYAERIRRDPDFVTVTNQPGLTVFACGLRPLSINSYPLHNRRGVVLGKLFERLTELDKGPVSVANVGETRSAAIVASEGRLLVTDYWGNYVAFIQNATATEAWIVQDPGAALTVFRAIIDRVVIYFSDLEDCVHATGALFGVNWSYLGANAVVPGWRTEQTALEGVSELQGGQCDRVRDGDVSTRTYWTPATFARNRLEDVDRAISQTRSIVANCVSAWASCYRTITHQLSGGVDSSIVLACLRRAASKPEINCITYYSEGPGTDERAFGRTVAENAGCRWSQYEARADVTLNALSTIAANPRPGFYLPCLNERAIVENAQHANSDVIMSGHAGDGVFGEIRDERIAVDYLRDHGVTRAFMTTLLSTARVARLSVGRVSRNAIHEVLRPSAPNPWGNAALRRKLLSADVREAATDPRWFAHPWIREAAGLPPAKIVHISMMAHPATIRTPLGLVSDPEFIHPLASQPVLELCASIPTYILTMGGETRVIARAAFVGDVPPTSLDRRDKGDPSRYVRDLLKYNLAFVRERLIDGQLVSAGILDRQKVRDAFGTAGYEVDPSELLFHISTDIWLERYRQIQQSAKLE